MSDRPPLTLPADQVVEVGDGFIITMASVWLCECPHAVVHSVISGAPFTCGQETGPYTHVCDPPHRQVPSPELVALNQPCPTCVAYCAERDLEFDRVIDCADCGGSGRLVFDLKAPCDLPMCVNGTPGRWQDGDLCGYCQGTRFVSHRVWLDPEMGVLPIIDKPSDSHGKPAIAGPCTSDTGERVGFVMPHGSIDPTRGGYLGALPSAARVGWYAARLRKVQP